MPEDVGIVRAQRGRRAVAIDRLGTAASTLVEDAEMEQRYGMRPYKVSVRDPRTGEREENWFYAKTRQEAVRNRLVGLTTSS